MIFMVHFQKIVMFVCVCFIDVRLNFMGFQV